MKIIHRTGEVTRGFQRCVRCGFILAEVNTFRVVPHPRDPWPVGIVVGVTDRGDQIRFTREFDEQEMTCPIPNPD